MKTNRSLALARSTSAALALAGGFLCHSQSAQAEVHFLPYAAARYEHYDNLFALPDDRTPPIATSSEQGRDDNILTYSGGLNIDAGLGRQRVTLRSYASRSEFDEYEQLDHDEYGADLNWNWRLASAFDGILGYGRAQRMVSFADTLTNQLLVENQEQVTASFNANVTPTWRIETRATRTDLESPRPGAAGLDSTETLKGLGLRYQGLGKLSLALEGTQTDGDVEGLLLTPDQEYTQTTGQLSADLRATPQSTLNANIGYTKRDNDGAMADQDAVTGMIRYSRTISVKTSFSVRADRLMNSYLIANQVLTTIDTGVGLTVNWQPTLKLGLGLNVTYRESEFPDQPAFGSTADREDEYWVSTFDINFQALRWLLIHPYARYETRESNDPLYPFDNTVAGIEFRVGLQPAQ
jgi:hypothetical protein